MRSAPLGPSERHGVGGLGHGLALDADVAPGGGGAQRLLLERRLLHQPVGEAAQEVEMRAAARESRAPTARRGRRAGARRGPCPRGRAPGAAGRSAPDITAAPVRTCAPTRRSHSPQVGGVCSEPGSSRVTGWRLPPVGDARLVGLLDDAPVRRAGDDRRQRACGRGSTAPANSGPAATMHGAALAHVAHDVVEIGRGQDALVGVAVEDDEVELLDLLLEQLARREGDQRQLVDRRAVLLLRRAQDGEVDEVDVGVRLQEVAPGALAGMRLAGDEEHAQLLADALDRDDGAVVGGRELVRRAPRPRSRRRSGRHARSAP